MKRRAEGIRKLFKSLSFDCMFSRRAAQGWGSGGLGDMKPHKSRMEREKDAWTKVRLSMLNSVCTWESMTSLGVD